MEERNEFTYSEAALGKAELRRELKQRRAELADKQSLSERAVRRVLPLLRGNVLVYVSIGSELNTFSLINRLLLRADANVYVPYTENGIITPRRIVQLAPPNGYGNLTQSSYKQSELGDGNAVKIDISITPLLGFNENGYRIGYGKGCFDRFFAANENIYKIGLAFDCQRCEFCPESNDVPLDCCVTESKVIYF